MRGEIAEMREEEKRGNEDTRENKFSISIPTGFLATGSALRPLISQAKPEQNYMDQSMTPIAEGECEMELQPTCSPVS